VRIVVAGCDTSYNAVDHYR